MKTNTLETGLEAKKDIEYMVEIERLLRELAGASEEVKTAIEGRLRERLKEYRKKFGEEAAEPYYEKLERIKKAA